MIYNCQSKRSDFNRIYLSLSFLVGLVTTGITTAEVPLTEADMADMTLSNTPVNGFVLNTIEVMNTGDPSADSSLANVDESAMTKAILTAFMTATRNREDLPALKDITEIADQEDVEALYDRLRSSFLSAIENTLQQDLGQGTEGNTGRYTLPGQLSLTPSNTNLGGASVNGMAISGSFSSSAAP